MRRSRTRVEVVWKGRMVTGEQWALWSVDGKKLKRVPAWQVRIFARFPKAEAEAARHEASWETISGHCFLVWARLTYN